MKQGTTSRNPHCLRSRKLNEEQLLLLKHFGEQPKTNKNAYKFLEESLINFTQENKLLNKKLKYSPPPITKRPRSYNKKQKSSSKAKKSNQKASKNKKINQSFEEQNNNNNKRSNSLYKKGKQVKKNINYNENKSRENYYKYFNDNSSNNNFGENYKKLKHIKKKRLRGRTNDNSLIIKNKNKFENSNLKMKNTNKNNQVDNIIINNINEYNENYNNEKIETLENKKIAIKALIKDYKIIETKDDNNHINNQQNNLNNINIKPGGIFEKINFKTTQENNINNNRINSDYKNININNNYLTNIIIKPSELDSKDIKSQVNNINNLQINQKQIQQKTIYGKIINNKRVIFALYQKPKEESSIKIIKKRKRRRLKNILNYNKYQERNREIISKDNSNEFKYLFQSNHKISKNYWHAKIDIISPKKYHLNKSQRSGSEDSYPKIRIGKKRGRKKKKVNNMEEDLDDIEISLISELKKNLKKTDGDVELLFNKSSIEKSSKSKSPLKQNNIKSTEISSQNISKEHKNKPLFEGSGNFNNNKVNNYNSIKKINNNTNNNKNKELINNSNISLGKSAVEIREEEGDNNNSFSLNDDAENLEFFSLTSTPEAKKRLRNNFNNPQYVYPNEQRIKRKYKKRKNKDMNSNNNDENKSNYNDSQFSINILKEKSEEYNNIDVDLSNSYYENKNKNN